MRSFHVTRRRFLTGTAGAALLAGMELYGCSRPDQIVRILITGDSHGHLTPVYHREPTGETFLKEQRLTQGSPEAYLSSSVDFPALAAKYGKAGGYAHLATLVGQERKTYPDRTILVDSGDAWYGSAIALLTEGRAPVEVMNAIGYDAMTLHWEFNLGQEPFLQRVKEARFAVLAQNLVDTDFGDRVLKPSLVKDLPGVKVGIVGQAYPFSFLTTEDRDAIKGWRLGYQDDLLQQEIDRLRTEEGVQIVILLSHMGFEQDRVMAGRLTGVDVIIGGHSHDITWIPVKVGKTVLVHPGSHGKFLGELDLEVSGGKVSGIQFKLLPVLSDRIEPDPVVAALIEKHYAPHRENLSRVIGETRVPLFRRSLLGGTSDAFMAQAYREIVGSDAACVPGWRFGTSVLPGPLTVEDVYNAMKPTASPLFTARLSGRLILRALEDNLDNVFNPDPLLKLGGDVLRCGNVRATVQRDAQRGSRVQGMMVGGAGLEEDRKYTIATSGGRTQYLDEGHQATSRSAVEELIDYIKRTAAIEAEPVQAFSVVGQ